METKYKIGDTFIMEEIEYLIIGIRAKHVSGNIGCTSWTKTDILNGLILSYQYIRNQERVQHSHDIYSKKVAVIDNL